MIPRIKPFELMLDEVIENQIDYWIESKQREPEQEDFDFGEEECQ